MLSELQGRGWKFISWEERDNLNVAGNACLHFRKGIRGLGKSEAWTYLQIRPGEKKPFA